MAKDYGMTPTDAMNRPAWQFWMDARIREAGVTWENEQQRAAQGAADGAGAATDGDKERLVDDQEARADQRESQDGQPDAADQRAWLDDGDGSGPGGDG